MAEASRDPVLGKTPLWALLSLPMAGFLIVPVLVLLFRSDPGRTMARLSEPATWDAIRLSAWTSGATTAIAVILGSPLAVFLARARFPGRKICDTLIDLPVVLPPAAAGIALLAAFGRQSPIGVGFGIELAFTSLAVVLAQAFVAVPLFVRSFSGALAQVDRDYEEAAALDGASPFSVARHITFPIARVGFFSGLALCWARAVGEFGATMLFAGNFPGRTQTIPLAIYLGFEGDFESAIALATVLLVASFGVLLSVRALQSR